MVTTSLARSLGCCLSLLAGLATGIPSPFPPGDAAELITPSLEVTPRAELVKRAPTCNTPTNRACWTTGFNINTDYEASFPATGVVRNVSTYLPSFSIPTW